MGAASDRSIIHLVFFSSFHFIFEKMRFGRGHTVILYTHINEFKEQLENDVQMSPLSSANVDDECGDDDGATMEEVPSFDAVRTRRRRGRRRPCGFRDAPWRNPGVGANDRGRGRVVLHSHL